jgi:hypothetical protein
MRKIEQKATAFKTDVLAPYYINTNAFIDYSWLSVIRVLLYSMAALVKKSKL